jgi:hypothetical protein
MTRDEIIAKVCNEPTIERSEALMRTITLTSAVHCLNKEIADKIELRDKYRAQLDEAYRAIKWYNEHGDDEQ